MGEEEREGVGDETEHVHRQAWTNRCSYFKEFFFFFGIVIDRYGARLEERFHCTAARPH